MLGIIELLGLVARRAIDAVEVATEGSEFRC